MDSTTEIDLAEGLLASLLGLLTVRVRSDVAFTEANLADLSNGRCALRFEVVADVAGASVKGALVGANGGPTRDLLSMRIAPKSGLEHGGSRPQKAPPLERLGVVYAALGESSLASHIPYETRQWLRQAIGEKVRKGGSLDVHAGLSGRGLADAATVLDQCNRDRALLRALDAVAAEGASIDLWARCKRLAPLIRSFAKHDWPLAYALAQAPSDWPGYKVALFEAARCAPGSTRRDPKLPSSERRLHQIAKSNGPFSFHGPGVTVLAAHRGTGANDQLDSNLR